MNEGNKHALKYNKCVCLHVIQKVWDYIKSNEHQYHLGGALIESGYYPQLWSRIARRYSKDKSVCSAIKRVEGLLESRIVNSTMSGDAKSAAMAIFVLKNKYNYEDKQVKEVSQAVTSVTWVFDEDDEE